MKTNEIKTISKGLYEKMYSDGYSESVIGTSKWIIEHFENYCIKNNIENIDVTVCKTFIEEYFGFDYYNPSLPMQTVLRRPLLILLEYEENGNYLKTHQRGSTTKIPLCYSNLYVEYRNYLDTSKICLKSKKRKLWIFTKYFEYLDDIGIKKLSDIKFDMVHNYINSLNYADATIKLKKGTLREIYNWMYSNKYIPFSGTDIFPLIRKDPRNKTLSYYSKEEVEQLLSCIDKETNSGKFALSVISLLAYLGIRAGDLINLKFSSIDWNNNLISFPQQKTKKIINLPLIDEVKYPLIDYIKNSRNKDVNSDYIFITRCAPYTNIKHTSSIYRVVERCMKTAGIEFEGRHHGPHALRHSLATNMMKENVPISAISNILGHSSTKTTEIYLTVDESNLKEISLEVPNV